MIKSCGSGEDVSDELDEYFYDNEIEIESSDDATMLQFKELPSSPRDTVHTFRNLLEMENNIRNNRVDTEAGHLFPPAEESATKLDIVADEMASPGGSEKRLQFPKKRSRSKLLFNNKCRNSIGVSNQAKAQANAGMNTNRAPMGF